MPTAVVFPDADYADQYPEPLNHHRRQVEVERQRIKDHRGADGFEYGEDEIFTDNSIKL
jgi:hypothetical protein